MNPINWLPAFFIKQVLLLKPKGNTDRKLLSAALRAGSVRAALLEATSPGLGRFHHGNTLAGGPLGSSGNAAVPGPRGPGTARTPMAAGRRDRSADDRRGGRSVPEIPLADPVVREVGVLGEGHQLPAVVGDRHRTVPRHLGRSPAGGGSQSPMPRRIPSMSMGESTRETTRIAPPQSGQSSGSAS